MAKVVAALAAVLVVLSGAVGGCVALTAGALLDSSPAPLGTAGDVGSPAVPRDWVILDRAAAARRPGLPWAVLAAIGRVESDSGRSDLPGVSAEAKAAGAEGPLQFEPATSPPTRWSVPAGPAHM
jgi:hypothetical protein